MTWVAALAAIFKACVDYLLGRAAQKDHDKALEDKGRAEGAAELHQTITEAADDQARVNAVDRGGAADVLERLRKRIEQSRPP